MKSLPFKPLTYQVNTAKENKKIKTEVDVRMSHRKKMLKKTFEGLKGKIQRQIGKGHKEMIRR